MPDAPTNGRARKPRRGSDRDWTPGEADGLAARGGVAGGEGGGGVSGPDALALALADRLTAASEVLTQLAERDGRVREILRLRQALEGVVAALDANDDATAREEAERGLRWRS